MLTPPTVPKSKVDSKGNIISGNGANNNAVNTPPVSGAGIPTMLVDGSDEAVNEDALINKYAGADTDFERAVEVNRRIHNLNSGFMARRTL